jgi:hypothetical protein
MSSKGSKARAIVSAAIDLIAIVMILALPKKYEDAQSVNKNNRECPDTTQKPNEVAPIQSVKTERESKKKSYWRKPNNYIRVATLGMLAIYTGVTVCLLDRSTTANNISEENLVDSQRAFMTSTELKIDKTQIFLAANTKRPSTTVPGWRFVPMVKNSGNTPTRNFKFVSAVAVCGVDNSEWVALGDGGSLQLFPKTRYVSGKEFSGCPVGVDKPQSPTDPEIAFTDGGVVGRGFIGPQNSVPLGGIALANDFVELALSSGKTIYVFGTMHYKDIFERGKDRGRVTKFCYQIGPDIDKDGSVIPIATPCEHWNCADAECDNDQMEYRKQILATFGGDPPFITK